MTHNRNELSLFDGEIEGQEGRDGLPGYRVRLRQPFQFNHAFLFFLYDFTALMNAIIMIIADATATNLTPGTTP